MIEQAHAARHVVHTAPQELSLPVPMPAYRSLAEMAAAKRREGKQPAPKPPAPAVPKPNAPSATGYLPAVAAPPPVAAPPIQPAALKIAIERIFIDVSPGPEAPRTAFERLQQMPSWLTSLVLHLCMLMVLNSAVSYANRAGSSPLSLLLACMTSDGNDSTSAPQLSTIAIVPHETSDSGEPVESDQASQTAAGEPNSQEDEEPTPAEMAAMVAPITQAGPGDARGFQGAVAQASTSPASASGRSTGAAGVHDSHSGVPQDDDFTVDRFIDYDLGKLRGDDATRALREFNALGTESIPALVRGLNRAAQIPGTCPVMVLSNKLSMELQRTNDPQMIRYALENLGRDLPLDAAHRQRVEAVRQQLLAQEDAQQLLANYLAAHGIECDPKDLKALAQLFSARFEQLHRALRGTDPVRRHVAALQVLERYSQFTPRERKQLALTLINLLRDDDEQFVATARAALRSMSDGLDYGPEPGADGAAVSLAVRQWTESWGGVSRQQFDQRVARSLLTLAHSLEEKQRIDAARKRYHEVRKRFPDSSAADEAGERLVALGGIDE